MSATCSLLAFQGGDVSVAVDDGRAEELVVSPPEPRTPLEREAATTAMLTELDRTVEQIKHSLEVRDALIRNIFALYRGRRAPVGRIVTASELSESRLYQIRDGRR